MKPLSSQPGTRAYIRNDVSPNHKQETCMRKQLGSTADCSEAETRNE